VNKEMAFLKNLRLYWKSGICTLWFRANGIKCGAVACYGKLPVIDAAGTIRTGKRFVVRSMIAPSEIAAKENAQIIIGDRCFLNQGVVIAAVESIEIGDDTLIGDFCTIYDSNYHGLEPGSNDKPRPVVLGKNVWLGTGVLVMPGSQIGDHTVVAAKSVVRGTLPPRVLAAGNPAKPIKELDIPDGWRRHDG
jgi:acetyltransferase-like isoleucine patch superfamily enzyme